MQRFFNLVPRKRLAKRLKEAARALIKTPLFKAALRRWEATTRGTLHSLRLPLVGVAPSGRFPPPPPTPSPPPSTLDLFVSRQKDRTFTDAPQEVGEALGSDLDSGIELEKHIFSPDQTSCFKPIFRCLLSFRTPEEKFCTTSPPKITNYEKILVSAHYFMF